MDKVKIVYVITKGDMGGAQKYVKQLAQGLNRDRFEVLVVSGALGGDLKADKKLRWLSNDYRPYLLFYNDFLALLELILLLRKERPDVLHLNSSKAGVIGSIAGKVAGVKKIVFTAHGWVFSDMKLSYMKRLWFIWLHRIASIFQDKIINVSRYDRDLAFKNKIALGEKLVVIENGIDVDGFLEGVLYKEEAREVIIEKLNKKILNDKPWIGSIGRLVKEKNYSLLIEVANEIDGYFFVVGAGVEYELLSDLIKKNNLEDKFFIVSPKGEDAKLLRAFDVFVLSSRKEGLPYTLIEAMASRVPVVVSDVGGMPEIVENKGFVFKNQDKEDLVLSIKKALDFKDADKAFDFCKNNLDLSQVIKKVEEIYLL